MLYRYRLRSTGHSSAKYGPCEVCKKHASEVFIQTEERQYERSGKVMEYLREKNGKEPDRFGWTTLNCHQLFGHKECLESRQREPKEVIEL